MYVDFSQRVFKWRGIAGALVRPGSSSCGSSVSIGDCVLLNFQMGFFAISDSSDRDPGSSRRFLTQFDQMIYDTPGISMEKRINSLDLQVQRDNLERGSNRILDSVMGSSSCTFTGLHFFNTPEGLVGFVLHTGDSDLYEYDPSTRQFHELTEKNFWMVGKTRKLFQIDIIKILTPKILIMATDGVGLALTMNRSGLRTELAEIVRCSDVEDIPEQIMDKTRPIDGFEDDAAVIALATQSLGYRNKKIILSGACEQSEDVKAPR
jgi:hypothetical protein